MIPIFRAWHKKEKIMFLVDEIHFDGDKFSVCGGREPELRFDLYIWEDVILMQSTGLKDKNGKAIFEGDIIKLTDTKYCPSVWMIEKVGGCLRAKSITFGTRKSRGLCICNFELENRDNHSIKDYKIIGNIHENPKLLEGLK